MVSLEDRIREYEGKPSIKQTTRVLTDDDSDDCTDLEPFFFDEAEAIADHARRAGREKHKEKIMNALDRILEYDPKQGRVVFTKIDFVNLMTFDHDQESPLGPMRDTDASIDIVDDTFSVCKQARKKHLFQGDDESANALTTGSFDDVSERLFVPCNSANVLSVKIASSDVGFPIEVYGTVIARDSLDQKCVYLFRRDRDHSHIILTKDEELILIGPKRGLALTDAIYFEIDLKIKGDDGQRKNDKQLSKGYLTLNGVSRHFQDEMEVESYPLDSMLSKVVVTCAVEKRAVEATVAIEVVKGKFCGEITACTTNIRDSLVLHDSRLMTAEIMTGEGVVPLLRRVVAVGLKEKLVVTIARAGVCKAERKHTISKFTPRVNGGDEKERVCGSLEMRVRVTWSIISRVYLY
ncbi:hypothetical protein QOZ80_5BG0456610 [Eleusine coracana subsp. coracana]|nr:hypothetical protein QOZ80_5BG0456610 [Eleusine coracana subsp. coracana]